MVSHRGVTCGCPRLRAAVTVVRQPFSPPGNLQQFFITRRDNVSACSILRPRRNSPPLPPSHSHTLSLFEPSKKVSRCYLCSDTDEGRRTPFDHDNVFIIHRIIRRVGGNQVGRYYASIGRVESVIYRHVGQKPCRSNIPVSGVGSTHSRDNDLFSRYAHRSQLREIRLINDNNIEYPSLGEVRNL